MAVKKSISAHDRLLTEVELELMNIIWDKTQATIKDVVSHLPDNRKLAYTTVATIVKVLEQKGFLACQKDSYAHVFVPLVSKVEYESTCIDHLVTNVFDGEPMALLQRLIEVKELKNNDMQLIEETLKKLASSKDLDGAN